MFVGHGVMFTNGLLPRATNDDGALQRDGDWECTPTVVKRRRLDRLQRHDRLRRHDRSRRAGRRGRGGHPRRAGLRDRRREIPRASSATCASARPGRTRTGFAAPGPSARRARCDPRRRRRLRLLGAEPDPGRVGKGHAHARDGRGHVAGRAGPGGAAPSRRARRGRLARPRRRSRHRRGDGRDAGAHPFRDRARGAARRQARSGRETDDRLAGDLGPAHRGSGPAQPRPHGRSHLRLHRRGPGDRRPDRVRRGRRHLLLRLDPGEPRPVPARRERDLGSRGPRLRDHGSPAQGAPGRDLRQRRRLRAQQPGEHGASVGVLRRRRRWRISTSTGWRRSRSARR